MATTALQRVPSVESLSWAQTYERIRLRLQAVVGFVASERALPEVDLRVRSLLHLPQFPESMLAQRKVLEREIGMLASDMCRSQEQYRDWAREGTFELNRTDWTVLEAGEEHARVIHERFHYIGTFRTGRHFALYRRGVGTPAALATVSDMDVRSLQDMLPAEAHDTSLQLSRVFAFRWAPRNSITFLLGVISRHLKSENYTGLLLTWVNPNLGFNSSSYRASNWKFLGVHRVHYRYVDGRYVTAREAFEMQGADRVIQFAPYEFAPLQVWCYRLD